MRVCMQEVGNILSRKTGAKSTEQQVAVLDQADQMQAGKPVRLLKTLGFLDGQRIWLVYLSLSGPHRKIGALGSTSLLYLPASPKAPS